MSCQRNTSQISKRTISFDAGWLFHKGSAEGAQQMDFADSGWRSLDLPHDWGIEDLPGQNGATVNGPFSRDAIGKMRTGYTTGGTGWYRKHFTVDPRDAGKTAYIQFDGVYMIADVWVNGHHAGTHNYGYTSFWYDITPYLNASGQDNVIAVQVKNEGVNSRWYSGSGIYRHTWLTLVSPLHIQPWGVHVITPEIEAHQARINIKASIRNSGTNDVPFTCTFKIFNPVGIEVGQSTMDFSLKAGSDAVLGQTINIDQPALWSIDDPQRYQASVEILVNDLADDQLTIPFGIRSLHFDTTGFTLNGENILLKGGCFHHDNGPLGAAAIDRAEERKMELLKQVGFNAIRCSHNPPSPYLLDVCDRIGLLVIDEAFDTWAKSKFEAMESMITGVVPAGLHDYSLYFNDNWKNDIQSMVLRDRNHPSIIMWSIGNEIPEADDTSGFRIAKELATEVRKLDPTRPVTEGLVDLGGLTGSGSTWEQRAPHLALLDVIGYNYAYNTYQADHRRHPERIMYASEFMPPLSLQNWQTVENLPYVIGNFSWTAMDYLGEAGVGVPRLADDQPGLSTNPMAEIGQFFNMDSWPMLVNFQGDLDLIGDPKAPYYYQHVVWREIPLAILVHTPIPAGKREIVSPWGFPNELKSWNWKGHEGDTMQVHIYTRSKKVRLALNGNTIGEQNIDDTQSITATFGVPYEPGTLVATIYDDGREVASESLSTTGKPDAIRLVPDRSSIRSDRNDLSFVKAEIVDAEGQVVPDADDILIHFSISGPAEIAGVANGNHSDPSSFQQPQKKTWQGRCLAVVRPQGVSAGNAVLTAEAAGLKSSRVEIILK